MLGPIVPYGLLTWAGFLYIGFRARRRGWIVAGVLYAVAIGVAFAITPSSTPGQPSNGWGAGVAAACWVGGVVHAFLVRRAWLRWRAHADDSPWYDQAAGAPPPPVLTAEPPPGQPQQVLPPVLRNAGLNTGDYYAPRQAPQPQAAPEPARRSAPLAAHGGHRPLEVNTASRDQLLTLPGFTDQRVQAVFAARTQGPFRTVDQFADAANLAPHEHHRIRSLVTATPPPTTGRGPTAGRVVDF